MANMEDPKHCRRYQVKVVIEVDETNLPPSDTAALTEVTSAVENLFLKDNADLHVEEMYDLDVEELVEGPIPEAPLVEFTRQIQGSHDKITWVDTDHAHSHDYRYLRVSDRPKG